MFLKQTLSTILRHRAASLIIVLDIAITCAILCNTIFYLKTQLQLITIPSGLAESEIVRLTPQNIGKVADPDALARADLARLREIPGVKSVSTANFVPLGQVDNAVGIRLRPDQREASAQATAYIGDARLLDTFGLTLVAGRGFGESDVVQWPADAAQPPPAPSVIISRKLAERLFEGGDALGKTLYVQDENPARVIGLVAHLKRGYALGPSDELDDAVILPINAAYSRMYGSYVLRTDPARRGEVLDAAAAALRQEYRERVFSNMDTYEDVRANYFEKDQAMILLLLSICGALLLIALSGIAGIASFWVRQRVRQIGIRRALGATRGQILWQFQLENLLLSGAGVLLGMLAAYGVSDLLVRFNELPKLPAFYLPLGGLLLLVLGQMAVLVPALRAARVPPALAARAL
ncbi:ABC transporter permease [Luteimonas aquatica]|uniref:ABC transporter permease n=1 Tax=Luteimonas aquatica TaxID=450364 RepID=UPI001F567F25|nr:FtsX-like permease family protein [Luteimonas aquatica]